MGILKRCACADQNRCSDRWHFTHGESPRVRGVLDDWWGEPLRGKGQADVAFDALVGEIRAGTFNKRGRSVLLQGKAPTPDGKTIADLVDEYWTRHGATNLEMTEPVFLNRMKPILARFGTELVATFNDRLVGARMVADWRTALKRPRLMRDGTEREARMSTVNHPCRDLKRILRKAVEWGYLDQAPKISIQKEDTDRERRVEDSEVQALITAAPSWLQAMIIVALGTGVRPKEQLQLQVRDVDFKRSVLNVRSTIAKSKKGRVVPINEAKLHTVLTWAVGKNRTPHAPLFEKDGSAVTKAILRKAYEDAVLRGLGGCKGQLRQTSRKLKGRGALSAASQVAYAAIDLDWYDFRHEFASRHAEARTPLHEIQQLLGHSSILVTQRYIRHTLAGLMLAKSVLPLSMTFDLTAVGP